MIFPVKKYCLDANVLIQAWQSYYAPELCPTYWETLDFLGGSGTIFLTETVFEEIERVEDDLTKRIKESNIPILKIDEKVALCLKEIYSANPKHKFLVDSIRQRSIADPWVIAHAMKEEAVVVTKEEKLTVESSKRIKIPNVCENMKIPCINDFQMIRELGLVFVCKTKGEIN